VSGREPSARSGCAGPTPDGPIDGPIDGPSWYGVRCVFRHGPLGVYEERITLWTARSADEAVERAEAEAAEYCENLDGVEYARLAQAFTLFGTPDDGAEVFSLMRGSTLPPGEYVDRYFATGDERTA